MSELKDRVARYKAEHPHAYARDIAAALGVSEGELVESRRGDGVVVLDERHQEIFEALPSLGRVKTMTRNPTAVIERWGAFERVEIGGAMGQVVGEEIDLRLFLRRWARIFAVEEPGRDGVRRSLQLFDPYGVSVHKIYLDDEARLDAYRALVARHRTDAPCTAWEPEPTAARARPDAEIDVEGVRAAWDAMRDTHEFFGLLQRFGVARTQALRLAGSERAHPVAAGSLERALLAAADVELPIMIFVGNRGIIQIHTGAARNVVRQGDWINVIDPRFNLHVRDGEVASAWVVRKPTSDGIVTSLELFDARGENVLLVFGKRKPGTVEAPQWRAIVAALEAP